MTVSRNDKREWWQEYIYPKQTKKDKRSVHPVYRSMWVRFRDVVHALPSRINKLVSSNKLTNPKYRDKWPRDGK